jgi:16S rRNA (adenine1518-N6/adenine1519-N6)-dimethyltransferase
MNKEETLRYIADNKILPDKNFGQNFLCDEEIIGRIIGLSGVSSGDKILEIGPGIGALTDKFVDLGADITAIEIDKRLNERLNIRFSDRSNIRIICNDYLKCSNYGEDTYSYAVSNIPYYVMTPVMMKLWGDLKNCQKMTFMIEEEALRRIDVRPGSKQYGPLAVICSCFGTVKKEFTVPRDAFVPAPHTTSAVITITRDNGIPSPDFIPFVENCFKVRRKKLTNSFPEIKETILSMGIREDIRAEQLEAETFRDIFRQYKASDDIM